MNGLLLLVLLVALVAVGYWYMRMRPSGKLSHEQCQILSYAAQSGDDAGCLDLLHKAGISPHQFMSNGKFDCLMALKKLCGMTPAGHVSPSSQ